MKQKIFVGGTFMALLFWGGLALADDPTTFTKDYCTKVRERAAGDADLLLAPSVQVVGLKMPEGTYTTVGGYVAAGGYTARASFLWSPLDTYTSTLVRSLGDKDCAQQTAIVDAQQALEWLNDVGKENALSSQVSYLTSQKYLVEGVLNKATARVAAGYATIMDLTILQQNAAALDLTRVQAQGMLNILHAHAYVKKDQTFDGLMKRVQDTSMDWERKASAIRMLTPWQFNLQGGLAPPLDNNDGVIWFGQVTVQYNFGGLSLGTHENHYLTARQHELETARYELTNQLSRFREIVKANMVTLREQIISVDQNLANLQATHDKLLQHMDAPGAVNAEALVRLEMITAGSNRILFAGMLIDLEKFYGDK
jgi:hypothetical protein